MIFDDDNSYVMHKKTKKVIKMKKGKGVFVVDAYVPKKRSRISPGSDTQDASHKPSTVDTH